LGEKVAKRKSHPVLSGLVQIEFLIEREPFHDNNDHSQNTIRIWKTLELKINKY